MFTPALNQNLPLRTMYRNTLKTETRQTEALFLHSMDQNAKIRQVEDTRTWGMLLSQDCLDTNTTPSKL